jgi:hypothetical protein
MGRFARLRERRGTFCQPGIAGRRRATDAQTHIHEHDRQRHGGIAIPAFGSCDGTRTEKPVVYPHPAIEVVDPRFAKYKVNNAAVERLYTGTRWAEGPVWFADGRY